MNQTSARSYDDEYYAAVGAAAQRSAAVVVPLLLELVQPRSVVDVGCGRGGWLAEFRRRGVADILGIDGSSVDPAALDIPPERLLCADLGRPLRLDRRFELVVSLEVAEHLPATAADGFVDALTGLGDVVLFSAAIPGQGGRHHVNEQWPEYWAARFRARGLVPVDALRRRIWSDPRVDYWYAQNLLIYARSEALERWPRLRAEYDPEETEAAALVHPQKYLELLDWCRAVAIGET